MPAMSTRNLVQLNPWAHLRAFTDARIALGRVGNSQTTDAVLAFGLAHAQARDAVHQPLDSTAVAAALAQAGFASLVVHSAAADRAQYPCRPDLGRRLSDASRASLAAARPAKPVDTVFVIADGLSALAAVNHGALLLHSVRERLPAEWAIGPVVIAEQSRVALGDEIGELLGARQVVMLIGERPGLSSPDSLGIYLTHAPRVGRTDAERNCISNVRPAGLGYDQAADKLVFLLKGAQALGRSGIDLKDDIPVTNAIAAPTTAQLKE